MSSVDPATPPPRRHWLGAITCAVITLLLQVPMAVVGTELGWAGGVEVGVQTLRTGKFFGLLFGTILLVLVLTVGHWSFARRPRGSWTALLIASIGLSITTVGFTMVRASASFFLYLEP